MFDKLDDLLIRYEELMSGLNSCYETVKANRAELNPMAGLEDLEEDSNSDQKSLDVI